MLLPATAAHATKAVSGGTITFAGSVRQNTVVVSPNGTSDHPDIIATIKILPVSKARTMLSSDVLDYFATYAKPDAKLVSSTYQ